MRPDSAQNSNSFWLFTDGLLEDLLPFADGLLEDLLKCLLM